jgi:hypothetical protein
MRIEELYMTLRTNEQYAKWLREIASFLADHNGVFECDCEPGYESDTGAYNHASKCASWMEDHTDIVLRETADLLDRKRPTVVCLCGSTRFWREFQAAGLRETMAGNIVLSIGAASGTDDEHFGNLPREEYDRIKTMLDELHMRKVDLCDEVLILNVDGYIGESTARELAYAQKLGKVVRYLELER